MLTSAFLIFHAPTRSKPVRYVPHANRALRSFNMYLNVRKPPLRSKFKFIDKPLSLLFPRPENEHTRSKSGSQATSPRSSSPPPTIRSRSPSAVRPIPSIPPTTNPRGELIFSSRVDRAFREGYERYRTVFEKRREEKERIMRRQKLVGWLTRWWWDTAPGPGPSLSGTATPIRTLSSSSASRGRLSSSRSSTPPTSTSAIRQDASPQPLRQRHVAPPLSALARQASLERDRQVV